jgi:Lipase (class 3)
MATYTDTQIMMTLSALASISTAPRPSGESLAAQQQRIMDGINGMLQNQNLNLATAGGNWKAVWVGLSQVGGVDANLAYIATGKNSEGNSAVAVVVRGTTEKYEVGEDKNCGPPWAQFTPSSGSSATTYNVSQGFFGAFTDITAATVPPTSAGVTLLPALQALVNAGTTNIYVTGHSLGGAVATMVALYLQSQFPNLSINLYTFAAPTAGDGDSDGASGFAEAVNSLSPPPKCYINQYDAVPYGYWNLKALPKLYNNWDISMTTADLAELKQLETTVDGLSYVQPAQQDPALNTDGGQKCTNPQPPKSPTWVQEMKFQHANNTYLTLLGGPTVLVPVPTVTSVSVNVSGSSKVATVTIVGANFGSSQGGDGGVDIKCGSAGSYSAVTGFTSWGPTQIVCTAPEACPKLTPTYYVCVTTMYGTSHAGTSS